LAVCVSPSVSGAPQENKAGFQRQFEFNIRFKAQSIRPYAFINHHHVFPSGFSYHDSYHHEILSGYEIHIAVEHHHFLLREISRRQ
jgi:excinuclease UvrABC nuclease subunit